jgi:hypothetical protein
MPAFLSVHNLQIFQHALHKFLNGWIGGRQLANDRYSLRNRASSLLGFA